MSRSLDRVEQAIDDSQMMMDLIESEAARERVAALRDSNSQRTKLVSLFQLNFRFHSVFFSLMKNFKRCSFYVSEVSSCSHSLVLLLAIPSRRFSFQLRYLKNCPFIGFFAASMSIAK